jgi:hypothetical protein
MKLLVAACCKNVSVSVESIVGISGRVEPGEQASC